MTDEKSALCHLVEPGWGPVLSALSAPALPPGRCILQAEVSVCIFCVMFFSLPQIAKDKRSTARKRVELIHIQTLAEGGNPASPCLPGLPGVITTSDTS